MLIIRENRPWLRLPLLAGALAFAVVSWQAATAEPRDPSLVVVSALGGMLFGSAAVLITSWSVRLELGTEELVVARSSLLGASTRRIPFRYVISLSVEPWLEYDGEQLPSNRWRRRWRVVAQCRNGPIVLTPNPLIREEAAHDLVRRISEVIGHEAPVAPADVAARGDPIRHDG